MSRLMMLMSAEILNCEMMIIMPATMYSKPHLATLKAAFTVTIPVLFGYISTGIAFGLLLNGLGYSWIIALIMSVLIYAGAIQFIALNFFINNIGFMEIAVISLLVNFRHALYGLSLFDKFDATGNVKPYMIFSLTDETYALLATLKEPEGVDNSKFYFYIAMLNQFYWVAGSLMGAMAGNFITISTKGLDFALTALFIVLLLEQFKSYKTRTPFLIGGFCAIFSILFIGKGNMLLVSVLSSILILLLFKKRVEKNEYN